MKSIHTRVVLLLSVLALPMVAATADESANASASENIVVASTKSVREARRDLWKAEKEFYSIYNELNEDNVYDVRCWREAQTGSVMKVQTCRVKFIDEAIRDGKVKNSAGLQTNPELVSMFETFRQNVDTLTNADPELREAAISLNQARADYKASREAGSKN